MKPVVNIYNISQCQKYHFTVSIDLTIKNIIETLYGHIAAVNNKLSLWPKFKLNCFKS